MEHCSTGANRVLLASKIVSGTKSTKEIAKCRKDCVEIIKILSKKLQHPYERMRFTQVYLYLWIPFSMQGRSVQYFITRKYGRYVTTAFSPLKGTSVFLTTPLIFINSGSILLQLLLFHAGSQVLKQKFCFCCLRFFVTNCEGAEASSLWSQVSFIYSSL